MVWEDKKKHNQSGCAIFFCFLWFFIPYVNGNIYIGGKTNILLCEKEHDQVVVQCFLHGFHGMDKPQGLYTMKYNILLLLRNPNVFLVRVDGADKLRRTNTKTKTFIYYLQQYNNWRQ